MQKKEIRIVIYFISILLLILGITYFIDNVDQRLILEFIMWLGNDGI